MYKSLILEGIQKGIKMARISKPLTNTQIANAKPKNKLYRLYDGYGLCLKVTPSSTKIFEYRYVNPDTDKEDTFIIGQYPLISLAEARTKHNELRKLVVIEKINPKNTNNNDSFEHIYNEFHKIWSQSVIEKNAKQQYNLMYTYCMKYLGHLSVKDIKPLHIVNALKAIEAAGSTSQIKRAKTAISKTFKHAAGKGLCNNNPVALISLESFKQHVEQQHRTLNPKDIYKLREFISHSKASLTTRMATEFTLRTCCRIQNVVQLKWSYIDTQKNIISIPASIMKTREPHHIPITPQIQNILDIQKNQSEYVFASHQSHLRSTTPIMALNTNKIETSIHGLRHLASTILNETKRFDKDIIESILAHTDSDKIRETYNNAQYLHLKRDALQFWNDFIDKCIDAESNLKALEDENIIIIDR